MAKSPPKTASCAIPISALIIAVAAYFIAGPISKNLVGDRIAKLESIAVPAIIKHLQTPDPYSDFKRDIQQLTGPVESVRPLKFGTDQKEPPTLFATVEVKGSNGKTKATFSLAKEGDQYVVISSTLAQKPKLKPGPEPQK
jgi:hypothetical protein